MDEMVSIKSTLLARVHLTWLGALTLKVADFHHHIFISIDECLCVSFNHVASSDCIRVSVVSEREDSTNDKGHEIGNIPGSCSKDP